MGRARQRKQRQQLHPTATAASPELFAGRRGALLVLALALVLVGLAYANALHGEFVYDDQKQILGNPLIQQPELLGKALASDVWAFSGQEGRASSNYWRPVFVAWLSLHYRWFGENPAPWHLSNLLLHFLATVLAWFVLRALGARPAVAAAVCWLFAVSPVHVESVAWISGSPDLLTAGLLFAAYLAHLASRSRRIALRALALGAFALALLTKEIAIVFPAIVLVTEWVLREPRPGRVRAVLLSTLPYLGVVAAYLAVRIQLVGWQRLVPPGAPDLAGTLASAPALLLLYLRHAFWPFGLGPTYPFKPLAVGDLSFANFVLPLLAVLLLAWGAFRLCRRGPLYPLALAWFALPLAPLFDLRSFLPEDVAHDRYLYLPLFGALAFAATAAGEIWGSRRRPFTAFAAAGLVLALLLVPVTRSYNRAWLNEIALWERGVATNPDTAFPHAQLGDAYRRAGRTAEARRELERTLELNPGITAAHVSLADLDLKEGRLAEAERHLQAVLAQYPDLGPAIERLGQVYQAQGRTAEAIAVFEHGRRVTPYQRGLYTVNLAVLQQLSGRSDLARRELESLGADLGGTRDPKVMRAWWFLGELDREAGRTAEAAALYRRYLAATEGLATPDVLALRPVVAEQLRRVGGGG